MRRHHQGVPARTLGLHRPLDLRLTLFPLRRGTSDPTMRLDGETAHRATRTPEGPAALRLEVHDGALEAEAQGPGAAWALDHLGGLVGEEDDVSGFVPEQPLLRDIHRRHPGLRITRSGAVFEALVGSILEQQIVGRDARRNHARLVRRFGEPAPGPWGLLLPPAPERLAAEPYWRFHECGVERRRAEVIIGCASRVRRIEEAATMAPAAARERLLALPGVGEWTAAEVAVCALGDADAVSVGDYHLPDLVCWALAGEERGDDSRMLELLEPYRGHRGRVLRLLGLAGPRPPQRGPKAPRRDIARL